MNKEELAKEIQRLAEIMEKLRGPEGCPWDRKQTIPSLQEYLIEEAYEVVEAAQKEDRTLLKEELGDVLLQIVFQAQIAREEGTFDLLDVVKGLADKLVRRHPHVFSDRKADTPEAVSKLWQEIKAEEKEEEKVSLMDKVTTNQPALMQAYEVQKLAASIGFDWDDINDVMQKIKEEVQEMEEALQRGRQDQVVLEFGDLLFTMVNLARFLGTNPEIALINSIIKFKNRFKYMEKVIEKEEKEINKLSLEELDYYWEEAKKTEIK
ncbi:MAG TPA: nucleoside triphosphate pyrophosphohydrolase [Halanaerobiales bacterium]|nr:nucleoside triphosphate pyrophosphohydrolase [Halanaerobiales bacterium]HPZ62149.1 nucleoside triphosphate pyrophosphohydrolase [Halanaerobiales bacterium]HQD03354.1 nucleoside triphosphate pyrophosphohydrolase [Halanaerobiales bacterium]